MVRKIIMMAALVTLPILGAQPAQAQNNTEFCREYTKDVSINGRLEKAYGKACRQPDGSWEIVSLDGSEHARDKVHDSIYDDINKYETRRAHAKNGVVDRIVIVDRYAYNRPYYGKNYKYYDSRRSNYKYYGASYNGWPFVVHFNNHNRYGHAKKKYYKNARSGHFRGNRGRHHYGHRRSRY